MQKELEKGTFGYLNRNKIFAWKRAALMLSAPIAIFFAAWIINQTRENVMTVVAVVGCLPGCNQVVRAILASRYSSVDRKFWEEAEAAKGRLPVVYENVFTSYEKNYYVDCIAVCGREALGYSSDPKLDPQAAAAHIQKMLKSGSYKQQVRILKDQEEFFRQLRTLADTEPEPVLIHGKGAHPDRTREEMVAGVMKAFTL